MKPLFRVNQYITNGWHTYRIAQVRVRENGDLHSYLLYGMRNGQIDYLSAMTLWPAGQSSYEVCEL